MKQSIRVRSCHLFYFIFFLNIYYYYFLNILLGLVTNKAGMSCAEFEGEMVHVEDVAFFEKTFNIPSQPLHIVGPDNGLSGRI